MISWKPASEAAAEGWGVKAGLDGSGLGWELACVKAGGAVGVRGEAVVGAGSVNRIEPQALKRMMVVRQMSVKRRILGINPP